MNEPEGQKPVLVPGEYAYLLCTGRMKCLSPAPVWRPWEELDSQMQETWATFEALMSRILGPPPDISSAPQGNGVVWSFYYRNHRGEESLRRVIPVRIEYCAQPEYYPDDGPQWFLYAVDLDRKANRHFMMKRAKDIHVIDAPEEIDGP